MPPAANLTAAFVVATGIASIGDAVLAVWTGSSDPKFRDAPQIALQLELIAAVVVTAIASTLVATTAVILRRRLVFDRTAIAIAALWGAAYPFLLRFAVGPALDVLDPEKPAAPLLGVTYLIAFPLLLFLPLWKLRHVPSAL